MFLNDIGQPLILDHRKTYGPYEQHDGPLILTAAAFQDHVYPKNWCGQVFGSADDVARFQSTVADATQAYTYNVLTPNEPFQMEYKKIKNTLTLIPTDPNTRLYYLKNDYIRALWVDNLSGYLDFIPKAGTSFQRALSIGIDVIYIDDLCYMSDEDWTEAQRENIYALVELLRPKYLYGLRQDKLPKSLLDLCAQKGALEWD
ncbi:uncharacterized protein LOC117792029 [Drosophila innubila]|uniref:uncharacterized protein LOC117792029 n=1 Tax=Drosophila innubila TaxID=198719 RepID=UPI00148C0FEF|nr:uncharacterized protein LOC117792029 [Drosophila innubila]